MEFLNYIKAWSPHTIIKAWRSYTMIKAWSSHTIIKAKQNPPEKKGCASTGALRPHSFSGGNLLGFRVKLMESSHRTRRCTFYPAVGIPCRGFSFWCNLFWPFFAFSEAICFWVCFCLRAGNILSLGPVELLSWVNYRLQRQFRSCICFWTTVRSSYNMLDRLVARIHFLRKSCFGWEIFELLL